MSEENRTNAPEEELTQEDIRYRKPAFVTLYRPGKNIRPMSKIFSSRNIAI